MAERSDDRKETAPAIGRPKAGDRAMPRSSRRLSLALDPDGGIDVGRMRPETQDDWRAALPKLSEALGVPIASPAGVQSAEIPPHVAAALTAALSQFSVMVVAKISSAPPELVMRHAPYTDAEQRAIAPALDAVLQKRGGKWMTKYGEELSLLVLLASLTQQKLQAVALDWQKAQAEIARRVAEKPDQSGEVVTAA
jgi:ABC-type glycerol-3-phosphate transport system substrate-binding protein